MVELPAFNWMVGGSIPLGPANYMSNPNIDPTIRGEAPRVEDLKEKFREILHDELMPFGPHEPSGLDLSTEIDKAVDRLFDAVTQNAMLDPH